MQKEEDLAFVFFNEINIIAQLSSNRFERALPDGLTLSQFSVLNWFVRVDQTATPGRLARAFMVTGGAMTNTLKKLAAKELVSVEPDTASGRQKIVRLTEKGRQVRDSAIEGCGPVLADWQSQMPVKRLDKLVKQLKKVRQYLDEKRYET